MSGLMNFRRFGRPIDHNSVYSKIREALAANPGMKPRGIADLVGCKVTTVYAVKSWCKVRSRTPFVSDLRPDTKSAKVRELLAQATLPAISIARAVGCSRQLVEQVNRKVGAILPIGIAVYHGTKIEAIKDLLLTTDKSYVDIAAQVGCGVKYVRDVQAASRIRAKTPPKTERILELISRGVSVADTAKQLECTKIYVYNTLSRKRKQAKLLESSGLPSNVMVGC